MSSFEPSPESLAPQKTAVASESMPSTETKPIVPATDSTNSVPASEAKVVKRKREYGNRIIFSLAAAGFLAGLVAAYIFSTVRKAQPPVFNPVSSPYQTAIYANGIIESDQSSGSNINIYPEVSGPITQVLAREGQTVTAGTLLFTIDDSVQRATTEQFRLQADAALSILNELKAEPRHETLAVATAEVKLAESNLKAAGDQYDKDKASFDIDPKSISKEVLDTAQDAVQQANAGLDVAQRQFELTRAGAWSYDIASQQKQFEALQQSYMAASALLMKYSVKAPADGVVLSLNAAIGSYVSSQGAFDPYTEAFDQIAILGPSQDHLAVRCFVDEILISRLPSPWHIIAQMSVAGTDIKVPLEFVRIQPYVSPKIELSNERQEKVDLRVLPVIFRFQKQDLPVYPGQLVDVYIGQK